MSAVGGLRSYAVRTPEPPNDGARGSCTRVARFVDWAHASTLRLAAQAPKGGHYACRVCRTDDMRNYCPITGCTFPAHPRAARLTNAEAELAALSQRWGLLPATQDGIALSSPCLAGHSGQARSTLAL